MPPVVSSKQCPQCRAMNVTNAVLCAMCSYRFPMRYDKRGQPIPVRGSTQQEKTVEAETVEVYKKQCPACSTIAPIDQAQCVTCGRVFRTTFVAPTPPPPPQELKTRAVGPNWIPPHNSPPSAYFAPDGPAGAPSNRHLLDECMRQYKMLTVWQCLAIVFYPTTIISLAILIWSIVQKPNLRRQVAGMGVDPVDWARNVDTWPIKTFLWMIGITIASISFIFVAGLAINAASPKPTYDDQNGQQQQYQQQNSGYGYPPPAQTYRNPYLRQ